MDELIQTIEYILVNGFILAMLFWMVFWDSESGNPVRRFWIPRVQNVFIWFGLNAQWRMFAPNPPLRTIWPLAKLRTSEGRECYWEPSPYDKLTVWQKFRFKKFHKYYHEVVRPGASRKIKRDFAEYLAREVLPDEHCAHIDIYMVSQPTRRFGEQNEPIPEKTKQLIFSFSWPEENVR